VSGFAATWRLASAFGFIVTQWGVDNVHGLSAGHFCASDDLPKTKEKRV